MLFKQLSMPASLSVLPLLGEDKMDVTEKTRRYGLVNWW